MVCVRSEMDKCSAKAKGLEDLVMRFKSENELLTKENAELRETLHSTRRQLEDVRLENRKLNTSAGLLKEELESNR